MNNKYIFSVSTKSFSKSVYVLDKNNDLFSYDWQKEFDLIESTIKEANYLTYDEKHKMLSFMSDTSINNTRHNFLALYLSKDEITKNYIFDLIKNDFCQVVSISACDFDLMLKETDQEEIVRDFLYSGIEQNLFIFFIKYNLKDLRFGKSKAKISFEKIKDIKYPTNDQWELIKSSL